MALWQGAHVAVKVIKDDVTEKDKKLATKMLKNEAKALARVHHPNVVVSFFFFFFFFLKFLIIKAIKYILVKHFNPNNFIKRP